MAILCQPEIDNLNSNGNIQFASSMYVVSQFSQSNGIGGNNSQVYAYKGATFSLEGLGFQGFTEIIMQDVTTGAVTRTVFHTGFPYAGKIQQLQHYQDQTQLNYGSPYRSETYSWQVNAAHKAESAGAVHIYLAERVHETFDLSTLELLSTTTSKMTEIDRWGNVLKSQSRVEDKYGYQLTEQSREVEVDETNWWLNKVTKSTKVKSSKDSLATDSGSSVTQTFSQWHSSRKPQQVVTTVSDDPRAGQTSVFEINDYGLTTSVATTAQAYDNGRWHNQTRSNSTSYSLDGTSAASDGYFPYTQTNALGHKTTLKTSPAFGLPTRIIDANGLELRKDYDGLGRTVAVTQYAASGIEASPTVYTGYQNVMYDADAPSHAYSKTMTVSPGTATSVQYFDRLNRLIRTMVQDFDGGGYSVSDIEYDALGRKVFESRPYSNLSQSRYGTYYLQYDLLGRPAIKQVDTLAGLHSTAYQYLGLTTEIDAGNLPTMSRSYNSLKLLMSTTDADNGQTRYGYNASGFPLIIEDAMKNRITAQYNAIGTKLWVNDPNQGRSTYITNGFGELAQQTDANNDVIRSSYDSLGRLISRRSSYAANRLPTRTATWQWDEGKLGLLDSESVGDFSQQYYYDDASRVIEVATGIGELSYSLAHVYDDNYGRLKAKVYPNNLVVAMTYNDSGYLTKEYNTANNLVYRQITAMDAFANITAANIAHGAMTGEYEYSQISGQMLASRVTASGNDIQNLEYLDYDEYGNLLTQLDNLSGTLETFDYDNLQRLTDNTLYHEGNLVQHIDYEYDALGNLTRKSDYANSYRYSQTGNAGPNAVSSVIKLNGQSSNFSYDAKGNLTSGDGKATKFNAFNKPVAIAQDSSTLTFSYGSDLSRYRQVKEVDGVTTHHYYVGGIYEETRNADGVFQSSRAYISDVAIEKVEQGTDRSVIFTHKDRLGSNHALTNRSGHILSRRSFDPFGKPRAHTCDILTLPTLASLDGSALITPRGFTDHEHLDDVQLIHMNGRVYDYNLGRFMSVDPYIQAAGNSQSINPYSYIMNNPLAGTDPTGYCAETDDLQGCADSLQENETKAITNGDGKKIGHVGKSSDGSLHITKDTSMSGQQAIQTSMSNSTDLGGMSSRDQGNAGADGGRSTNVGQTDNTAAQGVLAAQQAASVLDESAVVMKTKPNVLPFNTTNASTWELAIESASTNSKMVLLNGELLIKKLFAVGIGLEINEYLEGKDGFGKTVFDMGVSAAPFVYPATTISAVGYGASETFYPGGAKGFASDGLGIMRQGAVKAISPVTRPINNFKRLQPKQQESTLKRMLAIPDFDLGDKK
ncbi:RHS repeat domain-containing protein [Shewanella sp. 10N.286.45.A1]|uniref:RHS repeat domain-containing protein n=1 Tax=Shewanella sp. 10N.286.45.A1 TaxID=3229694 RepID=UPI00354B6846